MLLWCPSIRPSRVILSSNQPDRRAAGKKHCCALETHSRHTGHRGCTLDRGGRAFRCKPTEMAGKVKLGGMVAAAVAVHVCMALALAAAPAAAAAASPKMGLLLALYNANVTTDWVRVAQAAGKIPVRAIVPVKGVSPPDPDWAPDYPSAEAYSKGKR